MTRVALCDARGPLTDLIEKLSGEDGSSWHEALKKMLRKENPWGIRIDLDADPFFRRVGR